MSGDVSGASPHLIEVEGSVTAMDIIVRRFGGKLLLATRRQEPIFHYTDAAGLYGIVSRKEIWATDARFLNDTKEVMHGLEMLQAACHDRRKEIETILGTDIKSAWDDLLGRYMTEGHLYIAAFCANGDSLSQWRAYGAGGGYSIGVDTQKIAGALEDVGVAAYLIRVQYADAEKKEHLEEFISSTIDSRALLEQQFKGDRERVRDELGWSFMSVASLSAACFKDEAFADEEEFRIVVRSEAPGPLRDRVLFRPRGGRIVPYVALPLDTGLIENIVIGPAPSAETAANGVRQLVGNDVSVRPSKIPYRTW